MLIDETQDVNVTFSLMGSTVPVGTVDLRSCTVGGAFTGLDFLISPDPSLTNPSYAKAFSDSSGRSANSHGRQPQGDLVCAPQDSRRRCVADGPEASRTLRIDVDDGKPDRKRAFDSVVDPVRSGAGGVVAAVVATVIGGLIWRA